MNHCSKYHSKLTRAVKTTRSSECRWCHDYFTTAWSLYFTCITSLHSTVPGRIFTQGITAERPISQDVHSQNYSSFNKEFPLVWHFPDTAAFVCQTTTIQAEHGFHNKHLLVWRHSEPLPLCTVLPRLYDSGKCWAMVNGAEPMLLKFLPRWQKQMGGGGMGELGNDVESWGLGWFNPKSLKAPWSPSSPPAEPGVI